MVQFLRSYRRAIPLALLVWFSACTAPPPPNILVIVVDTLRFDRVGAYGEHPELTPFLNSLAQRSNVFWRAYAQSSWTMPSVASIFTSLYPSQHHVNAFDSVLAPSVPTLAGALKAHGYVTAAFTANILLRRKVGYARGFDKYEMFWQPEGKESAAAVNRAVLTWLDGVRRSGRPRSPVFLYLQYMEPHRPFIPPADVLDAVLTAHSRAANERRLATELRSRHPQKFGRKNLRAIEDLYDAEVRTVDIALNSFLLDLKERGFLQNAIIIVTADHGEQFYEHGKFGHGHSLYNEVIHVPLLVHLPSQTARVDIRDVVSQVDLAPTLLDLAGIPAPASFEGRSLRPILRGSGSPWYAHRPWKWLTGRGTNRPLRGPAYSELLDMHWGGHGPEIRAIIDGTRKLILTSNGHAETYDLKTDPGETKPGGLPLQATRALKVNLEQLVARLRRDRIRAARVPLDEQSKERLRVLGYAP